MGKLAVIEIGEGDFEKGFPVTIRIGERGRNLPCDDRGNLPQNPEILDLYRQWQESYNQFHRPNFPNKSHQDDSQRSRLVPENKKPCNMASSDVNAKSDKLKESLNQWLNCQELGRVRELLKQELEKSEQISVIVRTDKNELYQLPWHLWNVFDNYKNADVIFCPTVNNSFVPEWKSPPRPNKIKILAAFGHQDRKDDLKLDTKKDLEVLKKHLADIEEFICIVPIIISTAKDLTSQLREQKADIFYYAGHSYSEPDGNGAEIDTIKIRTLIPAFKEAVNKGLKLAIFNSCQGLGIAKKLLTDSPIPHVVVMREVIKDEVSHEFLNGFIQEFTKGTPLHLALRKAREKLHDLEEEYPSASLLPVIFQHSIEVPYWNGNIFPPNKTRIKRYLGRFLTVVTGLMMVGGITMGVMAFRNQATLDQIAKSNTVLIKGKNRFSGVIFAKKDDVYYVLTAKNVVNLKDKYKIVTVDKKETDAAIGTTLNKELSGIDLIILEFKSKEKYYIARLGNYDTAKEGTTFFVSGWSAIEGNKEPSYHFSEVKIVSLPGGLPNGYTLIYDSNTREGMIGGPLIDTHGCVIGIHGREETEAIRNLESAEIGRVKNGFNRGISMKKILQEISDQKLEKDLGRMDKDCK
ncbi:trypsin-like peptidase domain-containing protein [Microcoleus sp. PH2017_30_WIL_O_A]|uniref:trypsin-like peptidase domain-containing protein n=1 Tax=Microcoleus sp. PH2017_30_WIL_O_A TaxID=2798840 RepID=UPI001DF9D7FB|nr:trypsin-like peptidase domain-containing protein [Microcoleus sp. PH2017_30_WIL_O_A]MCC3582674.1 trypsin-like peptidase domain-containing protein [Microcoleus sp. PH2017_30_WIL_O_A]